MITKELLNPFPGLRSFEEDEDYLFFGREKQIDDLLKKLRNTRFISVVGTSGSGKSSLVKCGLLPALHSGYMISAGSSWRVAVFRPGDDPVGNMARSLATPGILYSDTGMEQTYTSIIEATLRRSSLGLTEAVRQSELKNSENLLIVVDQFEELFRFSRYEKHHSAEKRDSLCFADLLLHAVKQEDFRIYIVITMRSDFIGECTSFPGLPELVNEGQYLIPRMTREERKQAISGPVAVGGAGITPRLLTHLLNNVGDSPDQLPILQHALMRTWNYWVANTGGDEPLDIVHYEATGGMSEALSQHAEEAFQELETPERKRICEIIFKTITEKGEERQGIRRPAKLGEISRIAEVPAAEVIAVIDIFRREGRSFLMPPQNHTLTEESIIDISHESLMRIWDRLIRWVDEELQSADIYKRLAGAAGLYQESKTGFLRNPELQFALNWYSEHKPNRFWAQRYDPSFERAIGFLQESKRQDDFALFQKQRLEKLKMRTVWVFASILGAAALVSILFLIIALDARIKAEKNAQEAAKNAQIAADNAAIAKLKALEAEKQRQIAEDEKQIAEEKTIEANEQSKLAMDKKKEAEIKQLEADAARLYAESQKNIAIGALEEAKNQKANADAARRKAEDLKNVAEKSEQKTRKLQLISLARSLAFQALKESDRELSALLAAEAYRFNKVNGGETMNPEIFNALASVADPRPASGEHSDAVRAVAVSANGRIVASGSDDKTVKVYNYSDLKKPVKTISLPAAGTSNIRSVSAGGTGKYIAASDIAGNVIIHNNTDNNTFAVKLSATGLNSVCIDRKEEQVCAGANDGSLYLWPLKLQAGEVKNASFLDKNDSKINAVTFSPDGSRIATASEDGVIRIYSVKERGKPVFTLTGLQGAAKSVSFSPSGNLLAAGGYSGIILLWDITANQVSPLKFIGHSSSVNSISFSPDSELLASGSSDKTVRIWNRSNPDAESIVLKGHKEWVWSVAFSADGRTIISGSQDKSMRTWISGMDYLAEKACSGLTRKLTDEEWKKYIGENVNRITSENEWKKFVSENKEYEKICR
jgi:hypothetical protein